MTTENSADGIMRDSIDIGSGVRLYYEEKGKGRPVVFLHGVWGSSRFFQRQISWFGDRYRTIAVDFRGHGRSSMTLHGQTVETYAQDLHAFLAALGIVEPVLVGWSMGSFVIWDHYRQFGKCDIKAMVNIDQSPTDYKWADEPRGFITFEMLRDWLVATQTNRNELAKAIVPMMFKDPITDADFRWMYDEMIRAPEAIAGAILYDQSVRNFASVITGFPMPTLLCFGADEAMQTLESARWIQAACQNARLEVFEHSNHCPFLEETDRFNAVVDAYIRELD
jgi:pimeloyl-ACP methyl ester carboxylesterase